MCGRYTTAKVSTKRFAEVLEVEISKISSRTNVCPGQRNPVIHKRENNTSTQPMRWGLVPSWLNDQAPKLAPINARVETLKEKPYFRDSFSSRRCLVLADGYYEWRRNGNIKTPHFHHLPDGETFVFAGLWDKSYDNGDLTYAIITCDASESVRGVHHRMPIVLKDRQWQSWLDEETLGEDLVEILAERRDDFFYYPVSRRVNSSANEGMDLLVPMRESQATLFD